MMNDYCERDFLLQLDWREHKIRAIGSEPWLSVYDSHTDNREDRGIYAALLPRANLRRALSQPSWDLSVGEGVPACNVYHRGGAEVVTYSRFGNDDGIQPLVIYRNFHDLHPSSVELCEEFRHFHNLYQDERTHEFVKIAPDGSGEIVGRLHGKTLELRTLEVRQFLAIKEMHLAVYFSVVRFSQLDPALIGADGVLRLVQDQSTCYSFHASTSEYDLSEQSRSYSRLLGKKLIEPLPKERSGFWPFQEETEGFEHFVIGLDRSGDLVSHTCDPERLADYFGKNPEAPNYLTPVSFRREVLGKYYAAPSRYEVCDGYVACGTLWQMPIDNDHQDRVIVFLGDLGQCLSRSEQRYWRSFNVPPDGELSHTCRTRSFDAEFAEPENPELLFKRHFREFQEGWRERWGWPLFLPLREEDAHLFAALRIPLGDDQADFDSQVLALTKLLIDSINEAEIGRQAGAGAPDEKGITKLNRFLQLHGLARREQHVGFLRDLQDLRSSGVGHRKGKNYAKASARFGIARKPFATIFADILTEAIVFIEDLSALPTGKDNGDSASTREPGPK